MDYVGVFIERDDGKMLFQLRDDNPKIRNQNLWSLFGGGVKINERPIEAAIRELKEELGLLVKEEQLHLWMIIPGIKKKNYLYKLFLKNEQELTLIEGAAMKYFSISEIKKKRNIVKSLKLLLYFYPIISIFKK